MHWVPGFPSYERPVKKTVEPRELFTWDRIQLPSRVASHLRCPKSA